MHKILVINPGSTSTKIAVYEEEQQQSVFTIRHSTTEVTQYEHVLDQFDFRYQLIIQTLSDNGVNMSDFSVIMGRGGMLPPVDSGVYEVNDLMLDTLRKHERGEHASNLGAFLAEKIASAIPGCKAYIADPVAVDELDDVARISGMPEIPRRTIFHALNHKATARLHASIVGKRYEDLNLVVAHLGGGVTIGAHRKGRVIEVNQGLDGWGAMSPERAGTIDAGLLVRMCFTGKYTQHEILRKLAGQGGLIAHCGSNNVQELVKKAESGDEQVAKVLQAFAYSVGKEIGAMLAVLHGKTDGVILTGGVAYNDYIVDYVKTMIEPLATVYVYPGEDEMAALASNAMRILRGESPKVFSVKKGYVDYNF